MVVARLTPLLAYEDDTRSHDVRAEVTGSGFSLFNSATPDMITCVSTLCWSHLAIALTVRDR